ncbi:MAG TPA: superoxide dismutase [Cu-Zn] SodC [Gammaproteobacteria bacterium]
MIRTSLPLALMLGACSLAVNASQVVQMNLVNEKGASRHIGEITITETPHGLVFTPALSDLTPGLHGFHVHQNPDCGPAKKDGKLIGALAAGGHYDPDDTQRHGTPWGDGHRGDLPPLYVDGKGEARQPVLAPRLKMEDLHGRSLMIHEGGDNHRDHPAPLGGGGARIACGVSP